MSIHFVEVKCEICGFKTAKPEVEGHHQVEESIKAMEGSRRVKKIAEILFEKTFLNSTEYKDLFDSLMTEMGYDKKFELIDCMRVINEVRVL